MDESKHQVAQLKRSIREAIERAEATLAADKAGVVSRGVKRTLAHLWAGLEELDAAPRSESRP